MRQLDLSWLQRWPGLVLASLYMFVAAKLYGIYMHVAENNATSRNYGFLLLIATLLPISAFLVRIGVRSEGIVAIEGFLWVVFIITLAPTFGLGEFPTMGFLNMEASWLITGVFVIGAQLILVSLYRRSIGINSNDNTG